MALDFNQINLQSAGSRASDLTVTASEELHLALKIVFIFTMSYYTAVKHCVNLYIEVMHKTTPQHKERPPLNGGLSRI